MIIDTDITIAALDDVGNRAAFMLSPVHFFFAVVAIINLDTVD